MLELWPILVIKKRIASTDKESKRAHGHLRDSGNDTKNLKSVPHLHPHALRPLLAPKRHLKRMPSVMIHSRTITHLQRLHPSLQYRNHPPIQHRPWSHPVIPIHTSSHPPLEAVRKNFVSTSPFFSQKQG